MSKEAGDSKHLEEEGFREAAIVDLSEEYRERKAAAQASESEDENDKTYAYATVTNVSPEPEPPADNPQALAEDGYEPTHASITIRVRGEEKQQRYSWSDTQGILRWYADGRLCSLVNESVLINTETSDSIVDPGKMNRRTSRAKFKINVLLENRLGLPKDNLKRAMEALVFAVGPSMIATPLYIMRTLYPQNAPDSALMVAAFPFSVGVALTVVFSLPILCMWILSVLKSLNSLDT